MSLIIGTNVVSEDEPCISLKEINEKSADQRSFHRFQVIRVVRNDRPAEFRIDLGLAKKHKADQFVIPSAVKDDTTGRVECLHKVGELRHMAEQLRNQKKDYRGPPTILERYRRFREKKKGVIQYGYGH